MTRLNLGSHYTIKNILKQCASPILMMLFISIYGVVDGLFIANFDGSNAFAGVNLIYPVICIVGGTGFMFGSGGSALTSKLLGEKKNLEANKVFSMMIYFGFFVGAILSVITFHFIDDLVVALAKISTTSTPEMIEKATLYGRVLIMSQPLFIVGNIFQNFFVVDEKQGVGFIFTIGAGCTNIVFDFLFIAVFKWGVVGAAIATMMGHLVQSLGPILYFVLKKDHLIKLVRTNFDFKIIGQCSFNGLSDFIFNISANIIGIVYNIQLLRYIGQAGVEANGLIMYISFIFISIFIGITMGIAPVIGYNYGAKNKEELHFVIKNCFIIISAFSLGMTIIAELLTNPLTIIFIKNPETIEMAEFAFRLFAITFLFMGFSIFLTGMFTALNNGVVSGILSLFRSFIFQIIFIIVFPLFLDSVGIWLAAIFTETASIIFAFVLYFANKKKYGY